MTCEIRANPARNALGVGVGVRECPLEVIWHKPTVHAFCVYESAYTSILHSDYYFLFYYYYFLYTKYIYIAQDREKLQMRYVYICSDGRVATTTLAI